MTTASIDRWEIEFRTQDGDWGMLKTPNECSREDAVSWVKSETANATILKVRTTR